MGLAGQPLHVHLDEVGIAQSHASVRKAQLHGLRDGMDGGGGVVSHGGQIAVLQNVQHLHHGASAAGRREGRHLQPPVGGLHRGTVLGLISAQVLQGKAPAPLVDLLHHFPGHRPGVKSVRPLRRHQLQQAGQLRVHLLLTEAVAAPVRLQIQPPELG